MGFDWRQSSRIDHGVITSHPLGKLDTLTLTQPDGRRIRLHTLYQYDVYGGMLCGLPGTPEYSFIQAAKAAKRHFPNHEMPPVILEPVFHAGHVFRKDREGNTEYRPWLKLPEVCVIGLFDSSSPARDGGGASSVLVIWFQEHYGLPDDEHTLDQLRNLDWARHGQDWMF